MSALYINALNCWKMNVLEKVCFSQFIITHLFKCVKPSRGEKVIRMTVDSVVRYCVLNDEYVTGLLGLDHGYM